MDKKLKVNEANAEAIFLALKKHLSQEPEGESLISAFESNPGQYEDELADYLQTHLPEDEALAEQIANALDDDGGTHFANVVTGGQVDQIINVAKLGVLNMTVKKSYFAFRDIKQLALFLSTILMVAVFIYGGYWYLSQPIEMDGDFNIAVAQFGEVTENGVEKSTTATQLSDRLFGFLDSEFADLDFGVDIQFTHKNIPIIIEESEAEQIAENTNAHLVVYGNVFSSGDSTEFSPQFYVAEHPDTSELTGQNQLALPIGFDKSALNHSDDINAILRKRASILLLFIEGLTYLTTNDYEAASTSLTMAINEAETLDPFQGQEILYLISGMASRKQKDFNEAERSFEQALVLNPEYARARIGLGNINYSRYIEGGLSDGVLLQRALFEYSQASKAKDQPRGAYIDEKVNVALGNINLLNAQQYNDPLLFDEAIERYERVVSRYEKESDNVKLGKLASIAYFGLGEAYEKQEDYVRAREAYQQCLNSVTDENLEERAQERLEIVEAQL